MLYHVQIQRVYIKKNCRQIYVYRKEKTPTVVIKIAVGSKKKKNNNTSYFISLYKYVLKTNGRKRYIVRTYIRFLEEKNLRPKYLFARTAASPNVLSPLCARDSTRRRRRDNKNSPRLAVPL